MESESGRSDSLFTTRCGDRVIFCIGLLAQYRGNEQIEAATWLFIAKRSQETFGCWPVHFVDRNEQQRQSRTAFTGYRVTANCSAFNPNNPNIIEKAILIWHQTSNRLAVSDTVLRQIADLNWTQFAEATDY